ncbi:MAG: cytochrome C oxidase subunit IV family protein [Thermoanaerobaculia bacterium]
MTEHVAHEPAHAHVDHDPDHDTHFGHDNSPDAIRKEIRKYLLVLGALAVLTIITVAISYLHLETHEAIALALVVATVKGSLVAAFFMHLISERKLIYGVLLFTVFFFFVLIWAPWHHRHNAEQSFEGYDVNASAPAPQTSTEHSGH